jgi:hypothetical protein
VSRSNYNDDNDDNWQFICWRGAVASATNGRRGQAFLREMLDAMDALPEPKLVASELEADGAVCAIGAVGKARGVEMSKLDPEDIETVSSVFGVSEALAREIVYMNDEWGSYKEMPEERYYRMRRWVKASIRGPVVFDDIDGRWADDVGRVPFDGDAAISARQKGGKAA